MMGECRGRYPFSAFREMRPGLQNMNQMLLGPGRGFGRAIAGDPSIFEPRRGVGRAIGEPSMNQGSLRPRGHGAGVNRNGEVRIPKPPNFSIRSAPSGSPRKLRTGGVGRGTIAEEFQMSSDDFRILELRAARFELVGAVADDIYEPPLPPHVRRLRLTGYTKKPDSKGCKWRLFVIKEILHDRLVLRTIGVDAFNRRGGEVVVFKEIATFNGIDLTDFPIEEILQPGDFIMADNFCQYYEGSTCGGRLIDQAKRIGYPRIFNDPFEKEDRWITHGSVRDRDDTILFGEYMIDTEFMLPSLQHCSNNTVIVAVDQRICPEKFPVKSTVFVRAKLLDPRENGWTEKAIDASTVWQADSVALVVGVLDGHGFLRRSRAGGRSDLITICASTFGHIYVPPDVVPKDLAKLVMKEDIPVKFFACANRVPDDGKTAKEIWACKWRATEVIKAHPKRKQCNGHKDNLKKDDGMKKVEAESAIVESAGVEATIVARAPGHLCELCAGDLICTCG